MAGLVRIVWAKCRHNEEVFQLRSARRRLTYYGSVKRSFVGREQPLALLRAALARAVSGRGALVRVVGEPGVGKTRLADELVESACQGGLTVGWARSWKGSPPFGLVVELIRSAIGPGDALADAVGRDGSALAGLFPELGQEPGPVPSIRETTTEALLGLLRRLGPSLLILDDLHGADLDSLAFLQRLAPRLKQIPTLVVATLRSVATSASPQVEEHLADLARISLPLDLGGLDVPAIAALITEVTGHAVDERLAEAVHRATHGNALFVDGVLRAAVRDGSFDAGTLRFPRDVRQSILARAQAAGEGAMAVLRPAALFTRSLSVPLVAAVLGLDGTAVQEGLERALDESLLVRVAEGRFGFRHGLVAEALATTLPAWDRARIHGRIADALMALEGQSASLSEIAYHRTEAVPATGHVPALAACQRAVKEAIRLCAHEEAVRLLAAARDLLAIHAPGDLPAQLEVRIDLGRQLLLAGRRADARSEIFAAAALADQLGDVAALAQTALAAADTGEFGAIDPAKVELLERALAGIGTAVSPLRVRLAARLAAELWVDPAGQEHRQALSQNALAAARALSDPALLMVALDARFQSLWGPSALSERIAICNEMAGLSDRGNDVDEKLGAHRRRLLVSIEIGDMKSFSTSLDAMVQLAAPLKRPALNETIAQRQFLVAVVRGEFDVAARLADEILTLARRVQNPQVEMGNRFTRSELWFRTGDHGALAPLVAGFSADADRLPHLHFIRARTAQIAMLAGDRVEAKRHLELYLAAIAPGLHQDIVTLAGLAFASHAAAGLHAIGACRILHPLLAPYAAMVASVGATICVGSVAHHLGLLDRELGDLDAAVESFSAALALHQAMASPPLTAWSARELAATLRQRQRPGDLERADVLGRAAHQSIAPAAAAAPAPAEARISAALAKTTGGWQLTWQGRVSPLGNAKGLGLIAHLLRAEGRGEHVLDLVGAGELRQASGQTDAPALDAQAKLAYRQRLDKLREIEVDAADRGDARAVARARAEREAIEDELGRSVGLGGRDRAGGTAERARVAVAKSIRRALDLIGRVEADCAGHLERSLRTGIECVYSPDPSARVRWVWD